ncbi:MAG: hypothetical protein SOT60_04190 [Bilifractor sp.]|nr:hypothetical protein [Lachnospiraceae bacterium]MDY2837122.1 hypothetical protein [Bilifractor sp.]
MAGRKRTLNDRPLKVIVVILIAVMVVLFIRYMASPSGRKSSQENTEAVRSVSVSPTVGTENGSTTSEEGGKALEAVAADASVSSSSSINDVSGNTAGTSATSVSTDNESDSSAKKGDTAVLSDGNGNTVTVTYDSGVAWYDANQNVYSPLGSGNWMDASGNIYTEAGNSNASGDAAGGGSGINLVQSRG